LAATIVQIIPRLDTGGAEMAALEITGALAQAGARAIVLSEGGRMANEIGAAGGEWVAFPAATRNPVRIFANVGRLARFLAESGADLIHARSRAPAWSAVAAARRTGIPFVTTYHGAYGVGPPLKNAYNGIMAQGDRVIANSRFTADLIRKRHGTGEDRLRIVHRGVDLDAFDPAKVSARRIAKLKRSWGVKPADRIVLHAARLTGWKGQRVVIEAARQLREQGGLDGVAVILAGDAQGREDYRRELEAQIAACGLEGQLRLVGHCDDMAGAFAAADVALVASVEPEAFGRAAIEAQAMGCPVIAADLGALGETVLAPPAAEPGASTGWLVPPGQPGPLADAVAATLGLSASRTREIGRRARAHIAANFSLEAMRSGTLGVYRELLGSKLVPARGAVKGAKKSG
jgi:glycosyltransferase involved in cell wall biosynthesis